MKIFFKKTFYLFDAQLKKKFPYLVGAFLAVTFIDLIGIGCIGIFMGLVANLEHFTHKFIPITCERIFSPSSLIIFVSVAILLALFGKNLLTLYLQLKIFECSQAFITRLRLRLMSAYQNAPYQYHLTHNSSQLLNRIQENVDQIGNNILTPTLNLIANSLIMLGVTTFLLILYPIATGYLLLIFCFLALLNTRYLKKKLFEKGKIVSLIGGCIIKHARYCLQGFIDIRVLGKEKYFLNGLSSAAKRYEHAYSHLMVLHQVPRYLVESALVFFCISLSLIYFFCDKANLFPILGMFTVAGVRLLPCVNQLLGGVNQIRSALNNLQLVYQDLIELETSKPIDYDHSKCLFTSITLQNLSYRYEQSTEYILKNINLTINKGQSIGIIGASGVGKSTLVNLLLGLLEPSDGKILINNAPYPSLRQWLNNFAYIPQSIFLLEDSILRNIIFDFPELPINYQKLMDAMSMAKLTDFIAKLPKGLETMIGEDGAHLSGGQRQRIALARAFYHDKEIIVLDEATSSLDIETEKEVIDMIQELKQDKTIIVIAHRLSTVKHCDFLVKLEQGRIVAFDNFEFSTNDSTNDETDFINA